MLIKLLVGFGYISNSNFSFSATELGKTATSIQTCSDSQISPSTSADSITQIDPIPCSAQTTTTSFDPWPDPQITLFI